MTTGTRISGMTEVTALGGSAHVPVIFEGTNENYRFDLGEALPLYADQWGVETSNSAADNVTNLLLLIDRAVATGRVIVFRELTDVTHGPQLNANILMPVGNDRVSIMGMGWNTGVRFTGSAVDKGFHFNSGTPDSTPSYDYCGSVQNMRIMGQNHATQGVLFENVNHPLIWRCLVEGFEGCAVQFYDTLVGVCALNLFVGNGSSTRCAVEVGGTDGADYGSTNFQWLASRISGGLGAGGNSKLGGLSIDRCAGAFISGGNIESTGQPLSIGVGPPVSGGVRATSANKPVSNVTIGGELGFENPGNNNPFIDIGSGWIAAGSGAAGVDLVTCHGLPSGTTTVTHGVRAANTIGFVAHEGCYLACLNATSDFEFTGTNNLGPKVSSNRRLSGNAWPWVRENTTQRKDASPLIDWSSLETRMYAGNITIGSTAAATGATPSIQINPDQGGIYGNIILGGAADITNITLAGGTAAPRNTKIVVFGDGVRALVHGAGGNGQIYMRSGANFTPTATQAISFVADATAWREC